MNIRFIRIAFESVKGMKVYISIPFVIFHRIYLYVTVLRLR